MFNFAPLLIGAAVGAGTSLLTGSNPLRGGLMGGLTGGLFGGSWLDELLKKFGTTAATTGAAAGSSAPVVDVASRAAETLTQLPANVVDDAVLGKTTFFGAGGPEVARFGLPEQVIGKTTAFETTAPFSAPTVFNPDYTTLGGLINPTDISGLKAYMPSPQAIGGLALDTTAKSLMRPPVVAPAGGITAGKAPDIAAVEQLIKRRPRTQAGLLTDYFG